MGSRDTTVTEQRLQRAVALLQMLINASVDEAFDLEDEVREQLKTWGYKVPERREASL